MQSVLESNFSVENHYLPKECREEYGDLCREILLLDLTEDGNDTKEVAFLALTGAVLLVEVRHTDSQVFISDWYLLPLDHDDDHHCDPTSYSSMPSGVLAVCFNVDVPYLNVLSVHLDSMTGLLNGTATRLMYESSLQVEVPPLLSNFLPVVQPHAQKLYYSSQNYLHELQPFRLSSELDIGSMEPCDTAYHLALLESEQAGEVIIAYCRPDSACEVDTMTSFEECSDRQPYPCPNSSTKFFIETSAADGTFMITVLTENGSNEKSIYSSFASGMCLQTGQNTFFFVYTDGSGNMHLLSAEGLEEKQLAIPGCQDPPTYQLLQPFNNRYLIVNEQCGTTGNKKTVVLDMSDSFSRLIVTNDSEAVSFVVIPHVQKVIDIMATPDPNATGSNNSSVSSSAEPPTPTPSYPSSPPYSSPAATPAPSSPPIASHSDNFIYCGWTYCHSTLSCCSWNSGVYHGLFEVSMILHSYQKPI